MKLCVGNSGQEIGNSKLEPAHSDPLFSKIRAATWGLIGLALGGCATPAAQLEQLAAAHDWTLSVVHAEVFTLTTYRNRVPLACGTLHVYLAGDGTPWRTPWQVADDPTPRHPLVWRLMARDPAPAWYLGRPCYHGAARDPGCTPWHWTMGRYSETVVAALATALRARVAQEGVRRVVLIGHSGGGTLAWLLAPRIPQTRLVITLAGNLNLAAWTARHGYTPLVDSLDPAAGPPLPAGIAQWHLVGTRDDNVPPGLLRALVPHLVPADRVREVAADHRNGWETPWSQELSRLAAELCAGDT